jgi:hypothetical protein
LTIWAVPVLALAVMLAQLAAPAPAQNPDTMRPEESTAKAKELVQKTIQALGGPAYLGVKDVTRRGRLAIFDSKGALGGYTKFWDFLLLPDKNRTEYSSKRNVIDVYNGNQGWTLDRGGIEPLSAERIERFLEGQKKDLDLLLRSRLNEEGMIFRYAGSEILDLKQVDWVEIVDKDRITTRIAISRSNYLPMRAVYIIRDRTTRTRTEEVELFANYHSVSGVQTPLQQTRLRNDRIVYQVFFEEVSYNTGLSESFFTKEALDQVWVKIGKK